MPWIKAFQFTHNKLGAAMNNTWTCYHLSVYLCLFHRTQDTECGADRAMVSQRETVSGLLGYEEWRPKLVKKKQKKPLYCFCHLHISVCVIIHMLASYSWGTVRRIHGCKSFLFRCTYIYSHPRIDCCSIVSVFVILCAWAIVHRMLFQLRLQH